VIHRLGKKGFKLAHYNINSLLGHLDELKIAMGLSPFDVLALTETKLDGQITDDEINLPGYKIAARKDRTRNGGGVLIYCLEHLQTTTTPEHFMQDLDPNEQLECAWAEISLPSTKPFLVGVLYRPPDSVLETFFTSLNSVLNRVSGQDHHTYLMGDFNVNLLNPRGGHPRQLIDLMNDHHFKQLIDKPTRSTSHSSTLIDHIYTTTNKVTDSGVLDLGISDHDLVYCIHKGYVPRPPPKVINTRQWKQFNADAFLLELELFPWSVLEAFDSVDDSWSVLQHTLCSIFDKHAPQVTRRVRGESVPWMTDAIRANIYQRDHFRKKSCKDKDPYLREQYRKFRNRVNISIRTAKRDYFDGLIQENARKPDMLWKTLKSMLPKQKSKNITKLEINGQPVNNSQGICTAFNSFFTTIGAKLAARFGPPTTRQTSGGARETKFKFNSIPAQSIEKELRNLSAKKAGGIDCIPSKICKLAAPVIAQPLHYLFNTSLEKGMLPNQWKWGKVTPIYKDGPETNPTNYRPITVLPVIMKVFEKFVHNQLYQYVKENNILNPFQSGFRPAHSTSTALLDVTEYLYGNMDKGLLTGVIFLDLKKAFDTVDVDILLHKLSDIGVDDIVYQWFHDYLKTRRQSVFLNGTTSASMPIDYGVPQGSILGPLLFTLYINDLPKALTQTKVVLYADDTAIFYASKDIHEIQKALTDDLFRAQTWLDENKLTLNASKTKTMLFGTPQRLRRSLHFKIETADYTLEHVSVFKYLGAWLDSSLNWEHHINKMHSKVSQRLGVLKRVRPYMSVKTTKLLYNALVLPLLDYVNVIWSNCGKTLFDRVQRIQNRAARTILRCHPRTSKADMLSTLGWLSCKQRTDMHSAIMYYKILNDLAPPYLTNLITRVDQIHNHNTRSNSGKNMFIPPIKSNSGKKCFSYSGAILWNSIPTQTRNSNTLPAFRSAYLKHLYANNNSSV
jgi:exonuclease III